LKVSKSRHFPLITRSYSISVLPITLLLALHTIPTGLAQITPDRIDIKITAETGSNTILHRQVQLTTSQNVTGAMVAWNDLLDEVKQRSINASKITVTPKVFDVKQVDGPTLLNVVIDASDAKPGVYVGRLLITQGTGAPLIIPITVTLHDSFWWAFLLVDVGVALAVAVQLLRQRLDQPTREKKGAKAFLIKAVAAGKETGGLPYLLLSIGVAVAVLSAWQTYFPNLTTFGRSGFLDYAAAFLSGFGSQAIVNAAVDVVRKKA
jgi:hypothetical protein